MTAEDRNVNALDVVTPEVKSEGNPIKNVIEGTNATDMADRRR
jgi:hypothetical protein